jgi:hypothetical protein
MRPFHPIRLFTAVVVFGVVWELCARLDENLTDGAPLFGSYGLSSLMTSDQFGVTGRPNSRFSKWKMNSLGFRGGELRADREKVLCVGASETFGMYEPEGMEWARQLETELNRRAGTERYQVVNAGLPGQSLSSFARRAPDVLRRVRPSIVVLYPSPSIYIEPPPENYIPPRPRPEALLQLRISDKLISRFDNEALERLWIWLQTRRKTVWSRLPEDNVSRFRRDLTRLLDLMAEQGVRVVLATHATRFGSCVKPPDEPVLVAWRALYPTLKEAGFLDMENRMNAVTRREAAARGLVLVDAARFLEGPENFVEFTHFTAAGAAVLARAVADAMQTGGALE